VRGPALEVALAAACAGVADAEELSALVRRQAAELAVLEAQQDEAIARFRHLENSYRAVAAELAEAQARIEVLRGERDNARAAARQLHAFPQPEPEAPQSPAE
jgi:tellurite resistance protein